MRWLAGLAVGLGLLYLGAIALLWTQQRRFLFQPSTRRVTVAEAGLPGFADVVIETADGERIVAWWRPPEPGRAVIIYFHGNGGSLLNRRDRAARLTQDGRGLLLVSYRGYSGSTGSPSEAGLRLDADAAWRWLASYEPRRIVIYGESLGSGVAVRLATSRPVGGVILDAPYTSTVDVAKPLLPGIPVSLLMRDQFRSIDRIGRLGVPLLILHGDRDGVIPIALSDVLFAAAREPKRYVRLQEVDHVSVLEQGGLAPVRSFLDVIEAGLAEPAGGPAPSGG